MFENLHFRWRVFSCLFAIWGILNGLNGAIIFNHDYLGYYGQDYYMIVGSIRFCIGLVTLIIAGYLWITGPKMVVLERSGE